MSSRAWYAFKFARKVVFALATILSITWTIIYMILLLREWNAYNIGQRVIVIMALAINAVSAIFLYLMIVVMFRLRQDAVRVAFFLVLQLGSTVTFTLFGPHLPCKDLGSELDCRHVTSVLTYGGWVSTGLLFLYGFYLALMSYIPPPSPPPDPEAALLDIQQVHPHDPPTYSRPLSGSSIEKRRSVNSACSFIQSLSANPSVYRSPLNPSVRSISTSIRGKGVYSRSSSPSSMHSSPSLTSTVRGPKNNPTPYIHRTPSQERNPSQSYPNPFADPVSRMSSPSSVVALGLHRPLQLPPPALFSPFETNGGQTRPLPPAYADSRYQNVLSIPLDVIEKSSPLGPWVNAGTPISLWPPLQPPSPLRKHATSPGIESVHSMAASLHSEGSSAPGKGRRLASPALSTRSLGLPTTPRLNVRQLPLQEAQHTPESAAIGQQVLYSPSPVQHSSETNIGGAAWATPGAASDRPPALRPGKQIR